MLHISTDNANGHYHASAEGDIQVESPLNASPDVEQDQQQQQRQIQQKITYIRLSSGAFTALIIVIIIMSILAITLAILLGIARNGPHDYTDLKTTTYLAPAQTTPSVNISRPTGINVSQVTTQETLEAGYVNINGMLTIDLPFTDAFNDNTSDEYITLQGHFSDTVDAIFQGSSALYDQTIVTGFERHGHTTNLYFSIRINAELQGDVKAFMESQLQDKKIGPIRILYVQVDPGPVGFPM